MKSGRILVDKTNLKSYRMRCSPLHGIAFNHVSGEYQSKTICAESLIFKPSDSKRLKVRGQAKNRDRFTKSDTNVIRKPIRLTAKDRQNLHSK